MICQYCKKREATAQIECTLCQDQDKTTWVHLCDPCLNRTDESGITQLCEGYFCADHLWRCDRHGIIRCREHGEEQGCARCKDQGKTKDRAKIAVEGISKGQPSAGGILFCPRRAPKRPPRPPQEPEQPPEESAEEVLPHPEEEEAPALQGQEAHEYSKKAVKVSSLFRDHDIAKEYTKKKGVERLTQICPRQQFFHRIFQPLTPATSCKITIVNHHPVDQKLKITRCAWSKDGSPAIGEDFKALKKKTEKIKVKRNARKEIKAGDPKRRIYDIEAIRHSKGFMCFRSEIDAGELVLETVSDNGDCTIGIYALDDEHVTGASWLTKLWYCRPSSFEEGFSFANAELRTKYNTGEDVKLERDSWNSNGPTQLPLPMARQIPQLIHRIWIGNALDDKKSTDKRRMDGIAHTSRANARYTQVLWVDRHAWERQGATKDVIKRMAEWCQKNGLVMADAVKEFKMPKLPPKEDPFWKRRPRQILEGLDAYKGDMGLGKEYLFAWTCVDRGWAIAADILRVEILIRHGGFYIDASMTTDIPLDVYAHYGFLCRLLPAHKSNMYPANDIMACPANHPVIVLMSGLINDRFRHYIADRVKDRDNEKPPFCWCTKVRLPELGGARMGGNQAAVMKGTGPKVLKDALEEHFKDGPPLTGLNSLYVMTDKESTRNNWNPMNTRERIPAGVHGTFWQTVKSSSWQAPDCGCKERERCAPLTGQVRIWLVTWNCGNTAPSDEHLRALIVNEWNASPDKPDLIVIGVQEFPRANNTKIPQRLQNILMQDGQQYYIFFPHESQYDGMSGGSRNRQVLGALVQSDGRDKAKYLWNGKQGELGACRYWGKGGLILPLEMNGVKLAFISAHLDSYKKQEDDIRRIVKKLEEIVAKTGRYHAVFMMGDLNYRLVPQEGTPLSKDTTPEEVCRVMIENPEALQQRDHLKSSSLVNDAGGYRFSFPDPDFLPTYKINCKKPQQSLFFFGHPVKKPETAMTVYFSKKKRNKAIKPKKKRLWYTFGIKKKQVRAGVDIGWLDRIGWAKTWAKILDPTKKGAMADVSLQGMHKVVMSDHAPVLMKVVVTLQD